MEDEVLRAALAPSGECLSVEQLGRYADGALGADEQSAADSAHSRLSQVPGGARAAARGDVERRSRPEKRIVRDGVARLEQRADGDSGRSREPSSRVDGFVSAVSPRRRGSVLLVGIATGSFYCCARGTPPSFPAV